MVRDMVKSGSEWAKGTIMDPERERCTTCKIWLENGELKVRGYVAFFFRTQPWERWTP